MKKFNMKKALLTGALCVIVPLVLTAGACDTTPTADQTQTQQQEKMLQEGTRQTGMPTITNFKERKDLKAIYEARDNANLITYMYTQNEFDGKWVYQGEAMGFPIPYGTEYTNPSYLAPVYNGSSSYEVMPQADPNGLFQSQNSMGDWIMAINPTTNQPEPAFVEPNVYVKTSKIPAYLCESWSLPKGY